MKKYLSLSLLLLLGCESSNQKIRPQKHTAVLENQKVVKVSKSKKRTLKFEQISIRSGNELASKEDVENFCKKVDKSFKVRYWGKSHCKNYTWFKSGMSVKETPLLYTIWGDSQTFDESEKTLFMCGVHGDEITPVKFCFDLLKSLNKISKGGKGKVKSEDFNGKGVVLVPLVNPDSFFKKRPTRVNANGVDVNRNFPTKDWHKRALSMWKRRYRQDKRRNPGPKANTEPEVHFQTFLIDSFGPQKIISVHAPLTMLDYDGPSSLHTGGQIGTKANQLLVQMSKKARGYKIKNYPFFPGSLGNYAGNERDIPTYTIELPSSDARKHKRFWKLFKGAIYEAMTRKLRTEVDVASNSDSNKNNLN